MIRQRQVGNPGGIAMSMTELERLTTEARNPASEQIDRLDPLEIVRLMNAEDATVAPAVAEVAEPIAAAIGVIADRLRAGGRLVYVGAGTSGRLGVLDASECPPTFNTRPGQVVGLIAGGLDALTRPIEGAEDSTDAAVADLQRIGFSDHDVLVGIATSGRTPYVLGALHYANQLGAFTIGLTCNRGSLIAELARLSIVPVVGPEVISGSTRLKAGTATKLVLNMLTTGAMVLLGKTYGNLMVDLQATNQKLADRSRRIVQALTGLSSEQAEDFLQRAGGDVKRAAVTALRAYRPRWPSGCCKRLGASCGARSNCPWRQRTTGAMRPRPPARFPRAICCWASMEAVPRPLPAWRCGMLRRRRIGSRVRRTVEPAGGRVGGRPDQPRAGDPRCVRGCGAARGHGRSGLPGHRRSRSAGRPPADGTVGQRTRLAQQTLVTHDAMAVLAAADPQAVGVALISGTGSIAFARNRRGATGRSGGWGHLIGDEGSGWAIARQALQAAAQAFDGRGPETALTEALLQALDVNGPAPLLQKVYQHQADRSVLARLTPVVQQVAADGDPVARRILETAAADLATMYQALMARMTLDADQRILALAGGTLIQSDGQAAWA
jgi:N-acetylmuramic acid 6-phosphate etherase